MSATESVALRAPVAAGVKVTLMMQVADAASEAGQLLLCVKLLAFVPVMEMPVMASAALPVLDSVTGTEIALDPTAVLGKAIGFGLRDAAGAEAATPVPLTVTLKD